MVSLRFPPRKYRIVRQNRYDNYIIQVKVWWWPFWVWNIDWGTHWALESAELELAIMIDKDLRCKLSKHTVELEIDLAKPERNTLLRPVEQPDTV